MRQLTVIGTGLACAVGTSAADLLEALDGAGAEGSAVTRPAVSDGTPTQAVLARAKSAIDDLGRLKWRRYMGQEAEMFVAAGAYAARQADLDIADDPESVGIVCSTVTAGLAEYVQMYRSARAGTDRAANLVRGPQSSFNSPASHLSLHLGTQGGCMTLVGDSSAGLSAIKQAAAMLSANRVETVLCGGVDGLALAGSPGRRLQGEAAAVLALTMGDSARGGLAQLEFGADRLTAIEEAGLIVVTDSDIGELVLTELHDARRDTPMLVTEKATGVVGSAGGVAAVIAATEWVRTRRADSALCVSGDAKGRLTSVVVRAA